MKKTLFILFLVVLLGAGGYYYYQNYYMTPEVEVIPCEHEWAPATCSVAETCLKCGSSQGSPIAHVWGSTSCVSPEPCTMCGTTEGFVVEHQWGENGKICELCQLDARSTDEKFVAALSAGLEARWNQTAAYLARLEAQSYAQAARTATDKKRVQRIFPQEELAKYLQTEYDAIIEFDGALFESDEVEKWAIRYLNGLIASQQEIAELTDSTHWVDQYSRVGFHEQCLALYKLNELIPLNINEKYNAELTELLEDGQLIDAMNTLMDLTAFQNIQTLSDGRDRFEAIVRNTTGRRFETFSYEVNLLDAQNNVVDTRILNGDDWNPDQVKRFNLVAPVGVTNVVIVGADWMFEEE